MNGGCNNEKMHYFMAVTHYGFAISDITLFLDTHPNDQDALEYFHKMMHMYKKSVTEYENRFGPLTQKGEGNQSCWKWASTPWPWERGYY